MKLSIFLGSDKNFKTFIAYLIFGQIQLPGAVLNAELLQLSETVLGFDDYLMEKSRSKHGVQNSVSLTVLLLL